MWKYGLKGATGSGGRSDATKGKQSHLLMKVERLLLMGPALKRDGEKEIDRERESVTERRNKQKSERDIDRKKEQQTKTHVALLGTPQLFGRHYLIPFLPKRPQDSLLFREFSQQVLRNSEESYSKLSGLSRPLSLWEALALNTEQL